MEKLQELLDLNVNAFTEKKGGLAYLSWANAWKEFIKVYPDAVYTVIKNERGLPVFGNSEFGYMSYTTVTAGNITHEMWLPVMDYKNKAMLKPSMFDINKTVMRCLTKNLAMFGLGLYIYAGEDLPEADNNNQPGVRTLINRAINHPNVTEEKRADYIDKLKSKAWEVNQGTLYLICKENNIKC